MFGESTFTPVVFTDGTATPERIEQAAAVAAAGRVEIITTTALPLTVPDLLRERGYTRVVCEGGPRLLRDLFPVIDEIDLTLAPMLVGQEQTAAERDATPNPVEWQLRTVWDHQGFVFTQYVRA